MIEHLSRSTLNRMYNSRYPCWKKEVSINDLGLHRLMGVLQINQINERFLLTIHFLFIHNAVKQCFLSNSKIFSPMGNLLPFFQAFSNHWSPFYFSGISYTRQCIYTEIDVHFFCLPNLLSMVLLNSGSCSMYQYNILLIYYTCW